MPIVNIKVTDQAMSMEQKKALIEGATELLVQVLHKPRETVDVIIDEININNWGVGGKMISEILQSNRDADQEMT
ncbi:4-oxalocrotonate tautomerase family protein [Acinetobacter sichuanensis]|uniref:tautomerase family protein n=1 Tax=Acinetobacter sichuanensis TaxID=2136183 RepID=UPI00280F7F59|nr:4-oxalocrotonate tautomerase family protein [Acinetobacter sichuanensis]MDQ9019950.1 4-oxalocrotonate tautomerase family protein [Acinetobacter sichuanensis]